MPEKEVQESQYQSWLSDLFLVVGSSLVVYPAADMPRIALESKARLVIINQGDIPLDHACHLRFTESIGEVLPLAVARLKELLKAKD